MLNDNPDTFKIPKDLLWQEAPETPLERLAYIQDTGDMADVKIIFPHEEVTMMSHKIMLGMSSPVFRTLLYGSFSEAFTDNNNNTIKLPDDSSEIFKILLDHIYKGVTNIINIDEAREVYVMAHKYQINSLLCVCSKYLKEAMTTENVLKVYDVAAFFEDTELLKTCVSVINTSADMIISSEQISVLSQVCMKHLLNNGAIGVSSEVIMFKALLTWISSMTKIFERCKILDSEMGSVISEVDLDKIKVVQKESENRVTNSTDVCIGNQSTSISVSLTRKYFLPHIRFLTMSTEEFCMNVLPTDLLSGEEVKIVLMHIINYEFAPTLPDVVSCSQRTQRSQYAPITMLTCRLANAISEEIKILEHSRSGTVISGLTTNKNIVFGGINLGKTISIKPKSIITLQYSVENGSKKEKLSIESDYLEFSKFMLDDPITLEANTKLTIVINSASSYLSSELFSKQEGDVTIEGSCIQAVDLDFYFWTEQAVNPCDTANSLTTSGKSNAHGSDSDNYGTNSD